MTEKQISANEPVFLQALEIQFYRGIGPEPQRMSGFSKLNLFVGPNNAGKSVVLNFLYEHFPVRKKDKTQALDESTLAYRGAKQGPTAVRIGWSVDALPEQTRKFVAENPQGSELLKLIKAISADDFLWAFVDPGTNNWGHFTYAIQPAIDLSSVTPDEIRWQVLHHAFVGAHASNFRPALANIVERTGTHADVKWPDVHLIPAIRKVDGGEFDLGRMSGDGLIKKLSEMQAPDHTQQDDRKKFDRINQLLQSILEDPDVVIGIPHHLKYIVVHKDNKVLPLESLGTGIQQAIIIAAFCTLIENEIICIEEPEIHLHPILQRKLVNYLVENTSNQYFIATHSASFIDTPGASIFRVENDGVQTRIASVLTNHDRFTTSRYLGYKASDIVQANCVIWVEGPSDRIYLNHWIRSGDPALVEGIHYAIMFYGGRLLSHLTGDHDGVTELIKLRSLSRAAAILIDSDKGSSSASLNATKKRVKQSFQDAHGLCWITKGREIENYVPEQLLEAAVKEVAGARYVKPAERGQFAHNLHYHRAGKISGPGKAKAVELERCTDINKVAVATQVCSRDSDLNVLDLQSRIDELVTFILNSNGMAAAPTTGSRT